MPSASSSRRARSRASPSPTTTHVAAASGAPRGREEGREVLLGREPRHREHDGAVGRQMTGCRPTAAGAFGRFECSDSAPAGRRPRRRARGRARCAGPRGRRRARRGRRSHPSRGRLGAGTTQSSRRAADAAARATAEPGTRREVVVQGDHEPRAWPGAGDGHGATTSAAWWPCAWTTSTVPARRMMRCQSTRPRGARSPAVDRPEPVGVGPAEGPRRRLRRHDLDVVPLLAQSRRRGSRRAHADATGRVSEHHEHPHRVSGGPAGCRSCSAAGADIGADGAGSWTSARSRRSGRPPQPGDDRAVDEEHDDDEGHGGRERHDDALRGGDEESVRGPETAEPPAEDRG